MSCKKGDGRARYMCLVQRGAETVNHIMFKCTYSKHMWDTCARKLGLDININPNDNIWLTLGKNEHEMGMVRTFVAAYC